MPDLYHLAITVGETREGLRHLEKRVDALAARLDKKGAPMKVIPPWLHLAAILTLSLLSLAGIFTPEQAKLALALLRG